MENKAKGFDNVAEGEKFDIVWKTSLYLPT